MPRLFLAECAGQLEFARRDLFQRSFLAICELQKFRAQHGREIRFDDEPASQFLHYDQHVDRGTAKAALRFRHRQGRHAKLGQRTPGRV